MKLRIILLILVILSNPIYIYADIAGVSGPLINHSTITISGSGFGTGGPNVLFFDDFEGGTDGQPIQTGVGSATIGQWSSLGVNAPLYSTRSAKSGTKAFEALNPLNMSGSQNGWITLPDVTETFISWWNFVPSDVPFPGEGAGSGVPNSINWKIMWIMQGGTTDNDIFFCDRGSEWDFSGNNSAYGRTLGGGAVPTITKGQWKRFMYWIKDGYANDGTVKLWEINGTGVRTVINDINVTTLFAGAVRKKLSVNGLPRMHVSGTQPVQLFDDIYIATGANAQARVEIGNNATYTSCTNLAILTPTAWADDSITVTLNFGSFEAGNSVYVFVVNGAGVVSSGYGPITLSGGTDTTAPTVTSASVNGATATVNFDESVVTTGYDAADFNIDCTLAGNDVSLTDPSGSGTSRTFTVASAIAWNDSCNLDYVGGANDIEDAAGNDLATFSNTAVTNSATQPAKKSVQVGGRLLQVGGKSLVVQ